MSPQSSAAALVPLTVWQKCEALKELRSRFSEIEVLHRGPGRIVLRTHLPANGRAIVVKMWSRPDLRGKVRRLFGIAPSDLEWRNLTRLCHVHMNVPKPLGRCAVVPTIEGYTDALFMEDLGDCELSTDHLKRLINVGRNQEAHCFEDKLIEMAAQMLGAGMIDIDHGFANIVVQRTGRAVRLDLELARRVFFPDMFVDMYGEMLGRFIGMHAFAVQPDVYRSTQFSERLCSRLNPSRRVLESAAAYARGMMEVQRIDTGINMQLIMPWD